MTNQFPWNYKEICRAIEKHGKLFTNDWSPVFYGVRMERRGNKVTDQWQDFNGVLVHVKGRHINLVSPSTTMPGKDGFLEPSNDAGIAIPLPGFYSLCWQLDESGGRRGYSHLNQVGPIDYVRDNNRDLNIDISGPVYDDIVGFEYHQESQVRDSRRVGRYSEGCQVPWISIVYNAQIGCVREQKKTYAGKWWADHVSYLLLTEEQVADA